MDMYGETAGIIQRAASRIADAQAHTLVVRTRLHTWTITPDANGYAVSNENGETVSVASLDKAAEIICISRDSGISETFR